MKPAVLIGMVLALIGMLALGYEGFTYRTRGKIVSIGSVVIGKDAMRGFPLPQILGVAVFAGGLGLIVVGSSKRD